MPLSADKLSIFYRQMALQLSAGLTVAQALRAPSLAPARDTARMAKAAESGQSISGVLAMAGTWLPEMDRPFIEVAAQAGRLPLVLTNLAERYAQLAATRSRVLLACAYPVAAFHLGAVLFPFLRLIDFERGFQWSVSGYLGGLLAVLVPAWGGAWLLWFLVRRENPFALAMLDILPAIGGYRKNRALADFSFALGNLLEAGAPIDRAWLAAGQISRSPKLRKAAEHMHGQIRLGEAPGAHLADTKAFPDSFVARYQTGETTGGLESSLLALSADHRDTANQRMVAASIFYPYLLFGLVALMVAWFVLSFAMRYFGMINTMLDSM